MTLLQVAHVTKTYRRGAVRANDDVSLDVAAGEVFGLLGPNGAGKTTLVSQVLGLLRPDAGAITIDGVDVVANPAAGRQLCSYQPQAAAPVEGLTARQAVEIIGAIRGGRRAVTRQRAEQLLTALDLAAVADRAVPMSGGMARLTGFCMAAVVPGRVVVLDEPTNDVDPLRRRALWAEIRRLADNGAAVLLVTHNVLEAERCVDRLAIVAAGRVVAAGGPGELKARLAAPLRIECTLDPDMLEPELPAGATVLTRSGRRLLAVVQPDVVSPVVAWAQHAQSTGAITEFSLTAASLEDVYASYVGADAPELRGEHALTDAFRGYALLVHWQLLRYRSLVLLLMGVQVALGVGVVYGFSFLVPHLTPQVALYFATGAPTLNLILMGLTALPQDTAQARASGRFDYVAALPVSRVAPMLADVTVWLVIQLPGTVLTLLIAWLRFDIHLHIGLLLVPAVALVALTAASVGYAMAVALPPAATNQVTSFVSIALLLFSPINFPLNRLPMWLQDLHRGLPVTYMADIMRGGLTGSYDANRALAFAVVAAWCAAGLALSARAAQKRG